MDHALTMRISGQDSTIRGLNLNLRLIYIVASPIWHSASRGGFAHGRMNVATKHGTIGCARYDVFFDSSGV
jgi:hypothetical protein